MNFHNILHDDMRNGAGLRVVLFVSGCSHHCGGCHNPETWDENSGILFDDTAKAEVLSEIGKEYISGVTFSGGDPLFIGNVDAIKGLCEEIKQRYPEKSIWLYTGYTWEEIWRKDADETRKDIVKYCDVIVEGRYKQELANVIYKWAGSTNQRVIDIKKTLLKDEITLWQD